MSKPIVVVGAGMGGLAAALRLAHAGEKVILLEKTSQVGGRNRRVQVGDCDFDGGPTLVMMLEPFRKLFTDVGTRLEDHLELTLCDPGYRVYWRDGTRIESTTNQERMAANIRAIAPKSEVRAYQKLMVDLGALYDASIPAFVQTNFASPLSMAAPSKLPAVLKHNMLGSLAKQIEKRFQSEHLRQLFSFQTMYLGLSPYDAPWVYSTLAYMEFVGGIWYPKGGVAGIAEVIAELAQRKAAEIRLNSEVTSIESNRVRLRGGETIEAKAIIVNADMPYAERELEHKPAKRKLRYSCSAFLMLIDYAAKLPETLHHNVFFGRDFKGCLDDIFNQGRLPEDPAFYACISSKTDPSRAPEGNQNLFILVPCPNLDRPWQPKDAETLKAKVFTRLAEEVGFDEVQVREMKTVTPSDWQNDLHLDKGAAFGISHDLFQSAAFRPQNRSKTNPSVFYVGASTIPGNGLPMVLISADLAVQRMAGAGLLR